MQRIRPPAFAGSFYPKEESSLQKVIDSYIANAEPKKIDGTIKALIVPHAGYVYSGPVAAYGYKALQQQKNTIKTVILIGPSHRMQFRGCGLANFSDWRTPLGLISASPKTKHLETESQFTLLNETHVFEHSIEVQLPFLQHILDTFAVFPITTGIVEDEEQLAQTIEKYLDKQTVIIVSSDLSHYLPYKEANIVDKKTVNTILDLETDITPEQACGAYGIRILIELARLQHWKPVLLDYRNSGDTEGSKDKVVGYAAIALVEKNEHKRE